MSKIHLGTTKEHFVHTHALSTIPSKQLFSVVKPKGILKPLQVTRSVTVMVVNLYFRSSTLLPVHGFGYLIPRSLPFEQNPERALGVVFDSDATAEIDEVSGTKLTVMIGGHWWDGWSSYPDEEEGASMALAVLRRHLNIALMPTKVSVTLQRDCIPQYTVGHERRMEDLHGILFSQFGEGKLGVAGNSYTGVGVNDCIRAAWSWSLHMKARDPPTGLESFVGGTSWVTQPDGEEFKR